ncbi:MAG: hypothetical protein V2I82_00205 [Halieaceae bacterium]|jgi:uncharacterized protein YdeI (BOF family)|nr:hypothetical protein [Halieaceae bacterium]
MSSAPINAIALRTAVSTALLLSTASAIGAANPYSRPDGSLISLSGTVTSPEADAFTLDYGDGTITVEMDDWDSIGEAHGLRDGDRVAVYGRVDDDFFETATIEAASVYVENLNTFFYASAADEEGSGEAMHWSIVAPVTASALSLYGEVVGVDREDQEFTISTGRDTIVINTDQLDYNPLDQYGFQQIAAGDWVSVTGGIDYQFLTGKVIHADRVTTLIDESADS